jgi:transposase
MKHLGTEMKQQQIEWRRAKVLELSSQGYSEREIAEKLQPIAPVTIHRDLVYLRQQAQENLQKHIHEVVGWNEAQLKTNPRDCRNNFRPKDKARGKENSQ